MPPMVLPTKGGAGRGLRYAPEAPPPKGERNRKLVDDGCIVAAREERLLDIWCRKLQAELLEMEAPIIGTLKGSLDPDRAALLYPEEQRATHGRLAWAAKDKITEILSDGARLIKRAPRYPVHLLAQFEKLVLDPGHAIGWRVWAWAKLLKVWGSLRLRWSDLGYNPR